MATLRTTTTKPTTRTLADFPQEQAEKLAGFEADKAALEFELREIATENDHEQSIRSEAASLLAGTAVAVRSAAEVRRKIEVLTAAIESQKRLAEAERLDAAKQIAVEMLPEHRRIVADVAAAADAFLAAYARIADFRVRFGQASGGAMVGPLLELDINPTLINRFRNDMKTFATFVAGYHS